MSKFVMAFVFSRVATGVFFVFMMMGPFYIGLEFVLYAHPIFYLLFFVFGDFWLISIFGFEFYLICSVVIFIIAFIFFCYIYNYGSR